MPNPLRSEGEAFRFLLGAVVYFAAIAIAGVINEWAGLVVFIVLTVGVIVWWWRAQRREPHPVEAVAVPHGPDDERRILVIANETVEGEPLLDMVEERAHGYRANVLVVAPAQPSPLQHFASDDDPSRATAQVRLDATLARLREVGISARGEVGEPDPLQAIEDALRTFGPDEIIISTHPEGRSHWLEQGVVERARQRFAVPITHVVVDLATHEVHVK